MSSGSDVAKDTHEAREKGQLKKADAALDGLFDNIKVDKSKPKKIRALTPEQEAFLEKRRRMRRDHQETKHSDDEEGKRPFEDFQSRFQPPFFRKSATC